MALENALQMEGAEIEPRCELGQRGHGAGVCLGALFECRCDGARQRDLRVDDQVGLTAFAGPKAGSHALGRRGEEEHVLAFGRPRRARGLAVDARGLDRKIELPVEMGVALLDGLPALRVGQCRHGPRIAIGLTGDNAKLALIIRGDSNLGPDRSTHDSRVFQPLQKWYSRNSARDSNLRPPSPGRPAAQAPQGAGRSL